MADLKDTGNYQGLMSAVRDIMMKNQNLYQQDLESQYAQYNQQTPQEVEDQVASNVVDTPDPTDTSVVEVDQEEVYGDDSGQEEQS